MDKDFASRHHIVLVKKKNHALVEVIENRPLPSGNVTEETKPLEMALGDQVLQIVFNMIK